MRIPSQFNDESLYRGGKRPTSASGPSYRRLFRLFVALVLVVLVMREAARPSVYQPFFGDPLPASMTGTGVLSGGVDDFSSPPTEVDGQVAVKKLADQSRVEDLISRVVDGSVWRSEDAAALYFMLGTANEVDPSEAARVAILPLLQQPEIYRGRAVRIRGTVMRTESVDAAENEFGIDRYWNLWIRPADGGDRPLLAVVRNVSPKIEAIGLGGQPTTVPVQVHVVGRFLKRLAYRSAIGADLAPVIVGIAVVADEDVSPSTSIDDKPVVSRSRFILGVVLACVIGLGLAAITMWRTSVTARRARAIRHTGSDRSVEFLQLLSDSDDVEHASNERV